MKPPLIAFVCPLDATGRFGWFSSATVMVVVVDPEQPRAAAAPEDN
jgi:hypothetical protein